ncbi:MAG: efflux RND transporter permease subunit [Gemmatimonadota bacterium]
MSLFEILLRQRRLVYLVAALLSAAGVWAARRLPSAIYPELDFPRIIIVAQGTALDARALLFAVTRPLEEAVSIVPGVERVRSRSIRGGSEVSLYFEPATDMVVALQLVEARISEVRSELPDGVQIQAERMLPSLFPILTYNLEGPDAAELYDLARYQIKPALAGVPGVGRVDVQGGDVRELVVVADPLRLADLNLSYADLASAIEAGLGVAAVGRVERDYKQYLVVSDLEAHGVREVADVVVRGALRVGDLAEVRLGTEDPVRLIRGDGRPAALVNISRQPGGNTLAVADSVAAIMASLRPDLPAGVELKVVYDQASLVRESVQSVRDAMLIGAVLVVFVLLLFLHRGRITAISAAAIPLTMAVAVFGMQLLGQTFNLMSLGGMAVAIGLVIDNTVVVTENIVRHLKVVPDRHLAVGQALQELVWPVTTSTITTVVVFLPLGLLQGVVGQFFATLSSTLTVAVLVSLALALALIPLLAAQFVTASDAEDDTMRPGAAAALGRGLARAMDRLTDAYARALDRTLRHPRWAAAAALLLVVAGVAVQRVVSTGFLPVIDEGSFVLDYWMPGGTALGETDRQLQIVERVLGQMPEITGTSRRTGAEMGLFATGQNTGDIVARLQPRANRDRDIFAVIEEVRRRLATEVPRLRVEFVQLLSDVINDLAGNPEPIEIKLFGDRLAELEGYARRLAGPLAGIDGLVDFYDGVSESSPELLMRVDGVAAGRIGLTPAEVVGQVDAALLGVPAGVVRSDEREMGIRVRAPEALRHRPEGLASLPIYGAGAPASTPLGALATFVEAETREELYRENQKQMIRLTGGVEGRALGDVVADVKAVLSRDPPPRGVRLELGGQYAGQREAFESLLLVLVLAALCVVAVMVVEFESFLDAGAIVLAAPLSFVGAAGLLWVTGTPLNVSSFMGLILLVGLIVKNGIIPVDFTHRRMRLEGEALGEALRAAARTRLRPILMTTFCTLFALLPLGLGVGAGAELQRPLALAVIGGLALSTPVTLFLVPVLLVAVRGEGWRQRRLGS